MFFKILTLMKLRAQIHLDKKHHFHKVVIYKQQHTNNVVDALNLTKFTSKNSNTLKIEHSVQGSLVAIFCNGWGVPA